MQDEWRPIASVPDGAPVDVFYRNPTFERPVEGVLSMARRTRGFWVDARGAGVPSKFVVSWRPAGVAAALHDAYRKTILGSREPSDLR